MRDLLADLEARPEFAPAALATDIPLRFSQNRTGLRLPGDDESRTRGVLAQHVTARYFDVLRIPFVMGRVWAESEAATAVVDRPSRGSSGPGRTPSVAESSSVKPSGRSAGSPGTATSEACNRWSRCTSSPRRASSRRTF